jgi:hypothetical protein
MSSAMTADGVLHELNAFLAHALELQGGDTRPSKPGDRIIFRWPPHAVSHDYHVHPSQFAETDTLEVDGETSEVSVAITEAGVFGRSEKYWHEALGRTRDEMMDRLRAGLEPLLARQRAIADVLGLDRRFDGHVRDLEPHQLVFLLYCPVRDVGHEARTEIEATASRGIYFPALLHVLNDDTHRWRRCAQWAVLDMFEDLPSLCPDPAGQIQALKTIKNAMWVAPDDFARAIFKAGVVLGGHISTPEACETLIEILEAPSAVGRRSAIHGLFHCAEWLPDHRDQIIAALESHAKREDRPELAEFAAGIAHDIGIGGVDHVAEPSLAEDI